MDWSRLIIFACLIFSYEKPYLKSHQLVYLIITQAISLSWFSLSPVSSQTNYFINLFVQSQLIVSVFFNWVYSSIWLFSNQIFWNLSWYSCTFLYQGSIQHITYKFAYFHKNDFDCANVWKESNNQIKMVFKTVFSKFSMILLKHLIAIPSLRGGTSVVKVAWNILWQ